MILLHSVTSVTAAILWDKKIHAVLYDLLCQLNIYMAPALVGGSNGQMAITSSDNVTTIQSANVSQNFNHLLGKNHQINSTLPVSLIINNRPHRCQTWYTVTVKLQFKCFRYMAEMNM